MVATNDNAGDHTGTRLSIASGRSRSQHIASPSSRSRRTVSSCADVMAGADVSNKDRSLVCMKSLHCSGKLFIGDESSSRCWYSECEFGCCVTRSANHDPESRSSPRTRGRRESAPPGPRSCAFAFFLFSMTKILSPK